MTEQDQITATAGGWIGLIFGSVFGLAGGFLGPVWVAWEDGKAAGEMIAWRKVPEGIRICKSMLEAGGMNAIQEGYCAELLARALGEIE